MRHLSRTHRVALDWLFERENFDSKIQIRCNETKHQLAVHLYCCRTRGSESSQDDEWEDEASRYNDYNPLLYGRGSLLKIQTEMRL